MDTEYILDSAFELGETTAVENAVLNSRFGAYNQVRDAVDAQFSVFGQDFLQNTARARLDSASLPEKYFFALSALPALEFSLKAFAERAAHLLQRRAQHELGVANPLLPGLFCEEAQARGNSLIQQEADLTEGTVRNMLDEMFAPTVARVSEDLRLMADAALWYREDEGASFNLMLNRQLLTHSALTAMEKSVFRAATLARQQRQKALAQEQKSIQARAKAAIKKATKLFQNLGQEKNLSLFVSGHEVHLSHPDSAFKFVLRPLQVSGWLVDRTTEGRTHTPYELALFTKDDVFLANLCVYFENTPVLDQLLALTLFVESGAELELLEKANWFATGNWTEDKSRVVLNAYPTLGHKLPKKRDSTYLTIGQTRLVLEPEMARRQAHWEPFKGRVEQWITTWMEPATRAAQRLRTELDSVQKDIVEAQRAERMSSRNPLTQGMACAQQLKTELGSVQQNMACALQLTF